MGRPGTIEVYRSRSLRRSERWRWRLTAANGHILAVSSEGYANRQHAIDMARAIVVNGAYANSDWTVR